jgi:undecaprenyl-phosphate 4-deoxy-4-formamido-L-arabinose transferase
LIEVSIVVPVYRSEACLRALYNAVEKAMGEADLRYELVLVDDASPDQSWSVIKDLAIRHPTVKGLRHRRNFGQDNAIMTGMRFTSGRAIVIMDDDLQHSPSDIPKLYSELARADADVVFAHFRRRRQVWWKKLGSWFNGKVAEWLIDKPPDIYLSPFKIMRAEVAELVSGFDGPYPYIDSLLLQMTNHFAFVEVDHSERYAGKSNYDFWKSLHQWSRLAFSFSVKPLRLVLWLGILSFVLGLSGALVVIIQRLTSEMPLEAMGWASLMVTLLVLSSFQMLALGALGEYVGRTHININRKPQATIAETVGNLGRPARPEDVHGLSTTGNKK